jgi:hypothetical protein
MIGPSEGIAVDYLRGAMDSMRLKPRDRIGTPPVTIQLEVVLRPGRRKLREGGEDAIGIPLHRHNRLVRMGNAYGEVASQWSPGAKQDSVPGRIGAELETPDPGLSLSSIH